MGKLFAEGRNITVIIQYLESLYQSEYLSQMLSSLESVHNDSNAHDEQGSLKLDQGKVLVIWRNFTSDC